MMLKRWKKFLYRLDDQDFARKNSGSHQSKAGAGMALHSCRVLGSLDMDALFENVGFFLTWNIFVREQRLRIISENIRH